MSTNEQALGQILRELGVIRGDIGAMRETADARHRTLANEMHEVRAAVARAEATANDAKKIAETSRFDTSTMQKAVMDHTRGLVTRITSVEKENGEQTAKLDVLVKAAQEAVIREDERNKIEASKWKTIERWKQIGAWAWPVVAAVGGYLIAHWKP